MAQVELCIADHKVVVGKSVGKVCRVCGNIIRHLL